MLALERMRFVWHHTRIQFIDAVSLDLHSQCSTVSLALAGHIPSADGDDLQLQCRTRSTMTTPSPVPNVVNDSR